MSRYIPLLVVVGVVIVTVGVLYFAVWQSRPGADVAPPTPAPDGRLPSPKLSPSPSGEAPKKPSGLTIEGADIEQRDPEGRLEWKVTAGGELEFDTDSQVITGRDVQFEMVQQDKLPLIVVAPVFEADYNTRRLVFREGVKGRMKDGSAHFRVSHLTYDFNTRKLIGTGGAQFVQGSNKATAREIVLDAVAKKVRMRGGVRFEHRG